MALPPFFGETLPIYDPDAPVDLQVLDWTCSIESVQWFLRALGRAPDRGDTRNDPWLKGQLVPGYVTPELGLLDARGVPLAQWVQREYGDEMGLVIWTVVPITWDDLMRIAGRRPIIMGGHVWYHWSGVRRVVDGGLELANPAPNWKGVGTWMSRQEFDALGPFNAIVAFSREELEREPPPPPPPPPPPEPEPILVKVRALLEEAIAMIDSAATSA